MVGFGARRATWKQPMQERAASPVVYDERDLRGAMLLSSGGTRRLPIRLGADIAITSPLPIGDLDEDVDILGCGYQITAKDTVASVFTAIGGSAPNRRLRIRDLLVGDTDTAYAAKFTHMLKIASGSDLRVDIIDCRIYTATGMFDVSGGASKTLRECLIRGNDIVGSTDWEFATGTAVWQFCRIEGNNCLAGEMNLTDEAAGGGRNMISGNQFSGGEIITTAGSGFNVVTGNTLVTITAHADDEVVANT